MLRVPTLFVGEFDQTVGFNISDAFELFSDRRFSTCRSSVRAGAVVEDRIVFGKHVLCGNLRRTLQARLNAVAARTLGGDLSSGSSSILTDSVLGGIASLTFELRDHEARATRRKCCFLLVVPDEEMLVSRWPLICPSLELLASKWELLSQEIIELESLERDTSSFRTNVQPDRLRRIDELLDKRILPTESAALVEVILTLTCSRKIQLLASSLVPQTVSRNASNTDSSAPIFRSPVKHLFCEAPPNGFSIQFSNQLEKVIDRRALCVTTAAADSQNNGRHNHFLCEVSQNSLVLDGHRELSIPLSTLLARILRGELNNFNNFSIKMAPLLLALFSGNQIIVDVDPECGVSSTAVVLSLAEILPRALRKIQPRADEYIAPNHCRILAFSSRKEIVFTRETEHFGKDVFVLSELKDPSTVVFQMYPSTVKITEIINVLRETGQIDEGDTPQIFPYSQGQRRDSNVKKRFPGSEDVVDQGTAFTKSPHQFPTLINRVLAAVKMFCDSARYGDASRAEAEENVLHCQISQMVHEYVCRGRLYTRMLRRQKEEEYRRAMDGRQEKQSFASKVMGIFRRPSSVASGTTPRGAQTAPTRGRTPSVVVIASSEQQHSSITGVRYEKQSSGLSVVSRSTRFISAEEAADPNYVSTRTLKSLGANDLCDVLPVDHDILVFLGTTPSPFAPRDSE